MDLEQAGLLLTAGFERFERSRRSICCLASISDCVAISRDILFSETTLRQAWINKGLELKTSQVGESLVFYKLKGCQGRIQTQILQRPCVA